MRGVGVMRERQQHETEKTTITCCNRNPAFQGLKNDDDKKSAAEATNKSMLAVSIVTLSAFDRIFIARKTPQNIVQDTSTTTT